MTDQPCPAPEEHEHGLGAITSPPDPRDYPISKLYDAVGIAAVTPPATYVVPDPAYPILNQGTKPECVAYSAAGEQGYYDLRDTGLADFDEDGFFAAIGGGPNGAVIRTAFAYRLSTGYPGVNSPAGLHKIAAYYAVPLAQADLQAAIVSFGPIIVGTPWYHSWFHPVAGVLPAPDYTVGGHAIQAVGWDARGLRLRNSWGAAWSIGGDCWMPWAYLPRLEEAWKAVDVINPATYTLHIAANAKVLTANLGASGCIASWTTTTWGPKPSQAPCRATTKKPGCSSGSATVALVTAGVFVGKYVRVGSGVTVTSP